MSFDAGSAIGRLGLDVSGYVQGMMTAQSLASIFPQVVTNFLANPLLGVVGLLKDVAQGIVGMFQSATSEADRLNDLSAAVGVSVEALSGLGLVASQAGSGLDAVGEAYKFLGKNATEAGQGNKELMKDFARLGITAGQVREGMSDMEGLMMRVADGLAALPEGGARTNAAMALLGRSAAEMVPTLVQGSAAIREQIGQFQAYGAVVSTAAAKSADAWGDAFGEIRIAWAGLKQQLAEPIRDALMPYLNNLLRWMRTHPDEMKAKINDFSESLVRGLVAGANAMKAIAENLELTLKLISAALGAWAAIRTAGLLTANPVAMVAAGVAGATGGFMAMDAALEGAKTRSGNTVNMTINGDWDPAASREFKDRVSRDLEAMEAKSRAGRVREGL